MEDIKEKTADEMFEELGYKKETTRFYGRGEEYYKINKLSEKEMHITFWEDDKTFSKDEEREEVEFITMQELQAINKKCKELKWI